MSAAAPDDDSLRLQPCAHRQGLHACQVCGLVSHWPGLDADDERACCPRCGGRLEHDRRTGLQHVWAYLGAAAVMYVPANLLPVMSTDSIVYGSGTHTLLGGIQELWVLGSWELALIVFVASIAVPLLKMLVLLGLSLSVHRRWRWRPVDRTRLYRLVEAVGHWSMLDVLVVVLLVSMVHFGALATVRPEPGMLAFGAVVVLTMLASESFDPRWIWRDDEAPAPGATQELHARQEEAAHG